MNPSSKGSEAGVSSEAETRASQKFQPLHLVMESVEEMGSVEEVGTIEEEESESFARLLADQEAVLARLKKQVEELEETGEVLRRTEEEMEGEEEEVIVVEQGLIRDEVGGYTRDIDEPEDEQTSEDAPRDIDQQVDEDAREGVGSEEDHSIIDHDHSQDDTLEEQLANHPQDQNPIALPQIQVDQEEEKVDPSFDPLQYLGKVTREFNTLQTSKAPPNHFSSKRSSGRTQKELEGAKAQRAILGQDPGEGDMYKEEVRHELMRVSLNLVVFPNESFQFLYFTSYNIVLTRTNLKTERCLV